MAVLTEAQFELATGRAMGTSLFNELVAQAEDEMAVRLGFSTLTQTTFTDRQERGNGSPLLYLSGAPNLTALTTIKTRWGNNTAAEMDSSAYRIDDQEQSIVRLITRNGRVRYEGDPFTHRSYNTGSLAWSRVRGETLATYTAGWTAGNAPAAWRSAIVQMVALIEGRRNRDASVASWSGDGYSETYRDPATFEAQVGAVLKPIMSARGMVA